MGTGVVRWFDMIKDDTAIIFDKDENIARAMRNNFINIWVNGHISLCDFTSYIAYYLGYYIF